MGDLWVVDCGLDLRDAAVLEYSNQSKLILIPEGLDSDLLTNILLYSKCNLEAMVNQQNINTSPVFWSRGSISQPNLAEYWMLGFFYIRQMDAKLRVGMITLNDYVDEGYEEIVGILKTDLSLLTLLNRSGMQIVSSIPQSPTIAFNNFGFYSYRSASEKG